MKKVLAMSKAAFDDNFTNEMFLALHNCAFISILDPDNNEQKYDNTIVNFLQVKMHDIEEDLYEKKDENGVGRISDAENGILVYEKPSEIELMKIVLFIEAHRDKNKFFVHCSAGISRSGAVARYLSERFNEEVDWENFKRVNKHTMPNLYILKRLHALRDSL
jgi:predicted protein tyrosine phosphatase